MMKQFSNRVKNALRDVFNPFEMVDGPLEAQGFRAICHQSWPDNLEKAWEELWKRCPRATGFHTHIWQRSVWETVGVKGRLRLLLVWQGSALVGVLPMSLRDDGLLESMGPAITDFLDPLIVPELEENVWRLFLQMIKKLRTDKRPKVTLHYVRDDSPCRTILPGLVGEYGFQVTEQATEQTPVLNLPATYDDYLARFDSHERKETRRKSNKAFTKGNGKIVRCSTDKATIQKMLAECLLLMEMAPGAKGLAVRTMLRPFLEKAAPILIGEGKLWLDTLYLGEQPAASIFQFPYGYGPMLWNCGFDNSLKEFSPGVVVLSEAIKGAIERGATLYDMLRGEEPYKYKLGAVNRPLWMLSLTLGG